MKFVHTKNNCFHIFVLITSKIAMYKKGKILIKMDFIMEPN